MNDEEVSACALCRERAGGARQRGTDRRTEGPRGRREKGLRAARWAAPEHGERNTPHPSRARVTGSVTGSVTAGEPRPREPGQPPHKGVARSASLRGTAQHGPRG